MRNTWVPQGDLSYHIFPCQKYVKFVMGKIIILLEKNPRIKVNKVINSQYLCSL